MSLDELDRPRLDGKDCWVRHWGSGNPWDSAGFGSIGLLAWWADASGDMGSRQ